MSNSHSVSVRLGERSYSIVIGSGLLSTGEAAERIAALERISRAIIVTHPVLADRYAAPCASALLQRGIPTTVCAFPAGERFKTLRTVERLYGAFLQAELDRRSVVISVGGGVAGDLVGFAAATYLRGVRFVNVPTTLLAQVDAAIGGKTGVDLPAGKNLVGAFHQPSCVLIDTDTLATLPARELRSGLAEVVKYGVISDAALFSYLLEKAGAFLHREPDALTHVVGRSCEIKADVVAQDETEQGLRAILNYGHTIGHAIEAITRYRRFKHGEAISIGMVTEALLGELLGITPRGVVAALIELLESLRLPAAFPADISAADILAAAQRDKKTVAGRLHFVVPERLGRVVVTDDASAELVRQAIARHMGEVRAAG